MKILDWFIEKTPKYRQLLYDYRQLLYNAKMNYADVDYYKKSYENTQKAYIELNDLFDRLNNNMKETNKYYTKQIKKINTLLNKLDKKDTNVKAIKRLIKEMLCQRI